MSTHDWLRTSYSSVRLGLLVTLAAVSACGGGGGGGGSGSGAGPAGQPMIVATVITFPTGAVPPNFVAGGFNSAASVKVTGQNAAPITSASVTLDGAQLGYVAADQQYEGALSINPGAAVTVSVSVNGATYTASHTNFSTYPTITAPAANTTWSLQTANFVSWSGAVPDSTSQYAVGVFNASGALVWPVGGGLMVLPPSSTSAIIGADSLTAGNFLVLVGIIDGGTFPGAASGSVVAIGGFSYVAVTAAEPSSAVQSVATSPASVTVGIGKSSQLAATATYSDGSSGDVTTQANWSSADTTKVTVSSMGVVTGVAAGTATVTAQVGAFSGGTTVTVFQPNPSPTPPLSQAVAYQIDYAHSGRATVGGSGPRFPPTAHWSTILSGNSVSYPLIAGGKVFVTTNATPPGSNYGTTLYALDEATGNVAWGPIPLSGLYGFSGAAYDHGTLFVVNYDALLRTFDAATGTPGWSVKVTGGGVTSPPTAVNGIVYITGNGGGTAAVDETNGNVLWVSVGGDHSSPAVSADGVFVSFPCDTFKLDPIGGTTLWHLAQGCSGGGGKTAVYANNSVYVRQLFGTSSDPVVNLRLDAATGKQLGTFSASVAPAFSDKAGFFLNNGALTAIGLGTGNTLWTFTGDGTLISAPLVIDSVVVIGASSGTVYALDAATGSVLWSGSAGGMIAGPDEINATLTTGFGAGEGYLVVPAGNVLNGWRLTP